MAYSRLADPEKSKACAKRRAWMGNDEKSYRDVFAGWEYVSADVTFMEDNNNIVTNLQFCSVWPSVPIEEGTPGLGSVREGSPQAQEWMDGQVIRSHFTPDLGKDLGA